MSYRSAPWRRVASKFIQILETNLSILNILSPKTKATRMEFWAISAVSIVVSLILFSFYASSSQALTVQHPDPAAVKAMMPSLLLSLPVALLNLYLLIVTNFRRLNDLGLSKLWFLLNFVPFVGLIFFLYLGFAAGKQDTQRVAAA